jgi:TonB family protein
VILLICSTWLVYYIIDNESSNDLALNQTEDTFPDKIEEQPIISDSITTTESAETEQVLSESQPAEKKNLKEVQPKPEPAKIEAESTTQPTSPEPIELAEAEAELEIAAIEEVAAEKPAEKKEAIKSLVQPEAISRSGRAAAPAAAGVLETQQGFIAKDKSATRMITGKVLDQEDGAPLPGVNVIVKGTTMGTMTDLEGNYQVEVVDTSQTLVFSFVGLETKEENINGRTQLDVQLNEDISELSEVVVTGYGYSDEDIFTNTLPDYIAAEPEGGFRAYKIYLDDNLHYPIQAIENKVQGKVTVKFEISPTGTITDFQITKGIGFGCDEEAIRLIRQGPKWSAPKRGDTPVKGRVKVRVKFSLPK